MDSDRNRQLRKQGKQSPEWKWVREVGQVKGSKAPDSRRLLGPFPSTCLLPNLEHQGLYVHALFCNQSPGGGVASLSTTGFLPRLTWCFSFLGPTTLPHDPRLPLDNAKTQLSPSSGRRWLILEQSTSDYGPGTRSGFPQMPCSTMVMVYWSFYSIITKEVISKDTFEIHLWKHQISWFQQSGGVSAVGLRYYLTAFLAFWLFGICLYTSKCSPTSHKDIRSNTEVYSKWQEAS